MLKFFGQLILSFVITNWVYSELCLFYPPTQRIGVRLTQLLRLPTHNEWAKIAASPEARRVNVEIAQTLEGNSYLSAMTPAEPVKGIWNQGPGRWFSQFFSGGSAVSLSGCKSRSAGGFFVCPGLYQPFDGEILYLVPTRIESF